MLICAEDVSKYTTPHMSFGQEGNKRHKSDMLQNQNASLLQLRTPQLPNSLKN